MSKEWLKFELEKVKKEVSQDKEWISIPIGSTIYRFNLDAEPTIKTTQYGKRFVWTLVDGGKIGASAVLHRKLVQFFSDHGDLSACTIIRIGEGRDTRWQVI